MSAEIANTPVNYVDVVNQAQAATAFYQMADALIAAGPLVLRNPELGGLTLDVFLDSKYPDLKKIDERFDAHKFDWRVMQKECDVALEFIVKFHTMVSSFNHREFAPACDILLRRLGPDTIEKVILFVRNVVGAMTDPSGEIDPVYGMNTFVAVEFMENLFKSHFLI